MKNPLIDLSAFDDDGDVNAIIDTPKGSRNKFKYDEKSGLFKLGGALPLGAVFPFDFGYIPSTKGADGDPLDILILMDEPAFPGCLVKAKLIGVIKAQQTEGKKSTRNDRLIAVAADSRNHSHVRFLGDLNSNLVHEIERFFISYNETKGKRFEVLGRFGPDRAEKLITRGSTHYQVQAKLVKQKATHESGLRLRTKQVILRVSEY
jgi:inorganic pyrophosphatase